MTLTAGVKLGPYEIRPQFLRREMNLLLSTVMGPVRAGGLGAAINTQLDFNRRLRTLILLCHALFLTID